MPEDTLRVVVDPSNSFDVLSRLGGATDRLGISGARVGEGFIRGERVIRTASANIAGSLLTAGSAADVALVAMQGLERVFRIGILPTIGVAAGVAILDVFRKQIERTEKASKDLGEELKKALSTQVKLSAGDLGSDLEAITTKMEGLKKETESTTTSILKFFGAGQGFGGTAAGLKGGAIPTTPAAFGADKESQLEAAGERRRKLLTAQADLELRIAQTKEDALSQDKEAQDISKANLEFSQKEAKLLEDARAKGISSSDFTTRIKALEITRDAAIAQARITTELEKQNQLEKDLADQEAARLKIIDEENAKKKVLFSRFKQASEDPDAFLDKRQNEAADFVQAKSFSRLSPGLAQKLFGAPPLEKLGGSDFSGLASLSGLEFTGLRSLDNLSITIK